LKKIPLKKKQHKLKKILFYLIKKILPNKTMFMKTSWLIKVPKFFFLFNKFLIEQEKYFKLKNSKITKFFKILPSYATIFLNKKSLKHHLANLFPESNLLLKNVNNLICLSQEHSIFSPTINHFFNYSFSGED
jgi:hypothetical protein